MGPGLVPPFDRENSPAPGRSLGATAPRELRSLLRRAYARNAPPRDASSASRGGTGPRPPPSREDSPAPRRSLGALYGSTRPKVPIGVEGSIQKDLLRQGLRTASRDRSRRASLRRARLRRVDPEGSPPLKVSERPRGTGPEGLEGQVQRACLPPSETDTEWRRIGFSTRTSLRHKMKKTT